MLPGRASPSCQSTGRASPSCQSAGRASPSCQSAGRTSPSCQSGGRASPGLYVGGRMSPAYQIADRSYSSCSARQPASARPGWQSPEWPPVGFSMTGDGSKSAGRDCSTRCDSRTPAAECSTRCDSRASQTARDSLAVQRPCSQGSYYQALTYPGHRSASSTPGIPAGRTSPLHFGQLGTTARRPASAGVGHSVIAHETVDDRWSTTPPPVQGSPCTAPTKPNSGTYRRPWPGSAANVGTSGCISPEPVEEMAPPPSQPEKPLRIWQTRENQISGPAGAMDATSYDPKPIMDKDVFERTPPQKNALSTHPWADQTWARETTNGWKDLNLRAPPTPGTLLSQARLLFERSDALWDASLWKQARAEVLKTGSHEGIVHLQSLVRLTTERALHRNAYRLQQQDEIRSHTVELVFHTKGACHANWFSRQNLTAPRIPEHAYDIIPPPLFFSDASPLDIAVNMRCKCGPDIPIVVVAEISDFDEASGMIDLDSPNALAPTDFLLRTDLARYLREAHHELRYCKSARLKNHMVQQEDPYILQCPGVTVFRGGLEEGYPFYREPVKIDVILFAMANLKPLHQVVVRRKYGKTDWYANQWDHAALLQRLFLTGSVGHHYPNDSRLPIFISCLPGSQGVVPQPVDALGDALKYWRRGWSHFFHAVFFCGGLRYSDADTLQRLDRAVNKDVLKMLAIETLSSDSRTRAGEVPRRASRTSDVSLGVRKQARETAIQSYEQVIQCHAATKLQLMACLPLRSILCAPDLGIKRSLRAHLLITVRSCACGDPMGVQIEIDSCSSSDNDGMEAPPPVIDPKQIQKHMMLRTNACLGTGERVEANENLEVLIYETSLAADRENPSAGVTVNGPWMDQKRAVKQKGQTPRGSETKESKKKKKQTNPAQRKNKKKHVESKQEETMFRSSFSDSDDDLVVEHASSKHHVESDRPLSPTRTTPSPPRKTPSPPRNRHASLSMLECGINFGAGSMTRAHTERPTLRPFSADGGMMATQSLQPRRRSCELADRVRRRSFSDSGGAQGSQAAQELKNSFIRYLETNHVRPVNSVRPGSSKGRKISTSNIWVEHLDKEKRHSTSLASVIGLQTEVVSERRSSREIHEKIMQRAQSKGREQAQQDVKRMEVRHGGNVASPYAVTDTMLEIRKEARRRMSETRSKPGDGSSSPASRPRSRPTSAQSFAVVSTQRPYSADAQHSVYRDGPLQRQITASSCGQASDYLFDEDSPARHSAQDSPARHSAPDQDVNTRPISATKVHEENMPAMPSLRDEDPDDSKSEKPFVSVKFGPKTPARLELEKCQVADRLEISLADMAALVDQRLHRARQAKLDAGAKVADQRKPFAHRGIGFNKKVSLYGESYSLSS